jgi:outer membrane cobalamin receptor
LDVDGVTGVFMRGNWGHEGKVLFIIDDMELNENMYSVTQLINHIPASQIRLLEVIRGPGSALYGGYAELGVIKITTKSGSDLKGSEIYGALGTYGSTLNRKAITFGTGNTVGNSTFSLMGSWSGMDISGGSFTDFYGDTYPMEDGWSNSTNLFLNLKYGYKGLETSFIYDDYAVVPTGYETQNNNRFRNLFSLARYTFNPNSSLSITPSLQFKSQTPYWFENPDEENYWLYKRIANQINGGVDVVWLPNAKTQVISGAGYRVDQAVIANEERENIGDTFYNDEFTVNHQNIFAFSQASYSGKLGNVFIGFRYEHHSITGSNIAPRIGYTKVLNNFNIKYLYSHAFRSPSIENVNLNPEIEIEKTLVNELELGYRFNNHLYGSVNIFDIIIKDPIIYTYDSENDEEGYYNDTRTGSTGFEIEMKTVFDHLISKLSYSYYDASLRNQTDVYKVFLPTGDLHQLMKGAPAHMIHWLSTFKFKKGFSINPTLSWYSSQYGYVDSPDIQGKAKPYLLANITLQASNILLKNFDFSISLQNMLNSEYGYIQPLGIAGDAQKPLPGRPFEVIIRLKYIIR